MGSRRAYLRALPGRTAGGAAAAMAGPARAAMVAPPAVTGVYREVVSPKWLIYVSRAISRAAELLAAALDPALGARRVAGQSRGGAQAAARHDRSAGTASWLT